MSDNDDVKTSQGLAASDEKMMDEGPMVGQDLVEQLQAELEQVRKQQEESLAQAQRTLADYANLKKRFEKEREELTNFAAEMLLMRLLPAIDNLDRAVLFATEADRKTSIFMGVKMTLQQLHATMEQVGLKRMAVEVGDKFDPHRHEAIESVEGEMDRIAEVVEAGYLLHEKVVRPARVKVGKG